MYMKRPRTPEEIAREGSGKNKYTLYLSVRSMEYIKDRCAKTKNTVSVSEVVDEAIKAYLETIRNDKK